MLIAVENIIQKGGGGIVVSFQTRNPWMKFCLSVYDLLIFTISRRTIPSVVSDLLMLDPSLSRSPTAPVRIARSEPARSTREIRLTVSPLTPASPGSVRVKVSRIVKTACERLDSLFMLVAATVRDLFPTGQKRGKVVKRNRLWFLLKWGGGGVETSVCCKSKTDMIRKFANFPNRESL
jgi:hypothetical protein